MLAVAEGEAAEEEEEEAAVVEVADEMALLVEAGAVVVEFEIVVETLVEEGTTEAVALRVAEGVTDGVSVCRLAKGTSAHSAWNLTTVPTKSLTIFFGT